MNARFFLICALGTIGMGIGQLVAEQRQYLNAPKIRTLVNQAAAQAPNEKMLETLKHLEWFYWVAPASTYLGMKNLGIYSQIKVQIARYEAALKKPKSADVSAGCEALIKKVEALPQIDLSLKSAIDDVKQLINKLKTLA